MSASSLLVVGNALRHTPSGTPVCDFSVATNVSWTDKQTGARRQRAKERECGQRGAGHDQEPGGGQAPAEQRLEPSDLRRLEGRGGFDEQSFTLEVLDNHPPKIISEPVTTTVAGYDYMYDVDAVDLEGPGGMFAAGAAAKVRTSLARPAETSMAGKHVATDQE